VEEGAGTDEAHVAQVGALREEAARLKAERDRARADHAELGARLEASESEAMRLAAAVNTELEAERARGQSCEKRLAAATARQGELEAELARGQVRLNAPKVRRPPRSARGVGVCGAWFGEDLAAARAQQGCDWRRRRGGAGGGGERRGGGEEEGGDAGGVGGGCGGAGARKHATGHGVTRARTGACV
jgi:hypothetical protein